MYPTARSRRSRALFAALLALIVAAAQLVLVANPAAADSHLPTGATIDNGVVRLGINAAGQLNFMDPEFGALTGVRFLPTGNEATAPGCPCEGWGAGDELTGMSGWANQDEGGEFNLDVVDFTIDEVAGEVVSVVDVLGDGATQVMRVTHRYAPSTTEFLYQATVTIENLTDADIQPRYRRVMDWDVEPTAFSEFVTIDGVVGENLRYSSTNGFDTANPLSMPNTSGYLIGPGTESGGDFFADAGPNDHGALFDFGFDPLPPGETRSFNIFYGAAPTETEALQAIDFVGATVWSLGQPSTLDGPTLGTPNTFVFGFSAVGTGVVPRVGLRKASENTEIDAGDQNGWRVVITNPITEPVELTSLVDVLPPGFTYVPGSSTLDVSPFADPTVEGQRLTWAGPIPIDGRATRTLAFDAVSADDIAPGTYRNEASGSAQLAGDDSAIPVRSTGPVAPVVVREPVVTSDTAATAPTGSVTEDDLGRPIISMPRGGRSDITISTEVECPEGTTLTEVVLRHGGKDFEPTEVDGVLHTFMIPAADLVDGPIEGIVVCDAIEITNTVGRITLYDPSGIITDASTGEPIVGATVTLYKIPFAMPDTDASPGDCRTVDTRSAPEFAGEPSANLASGVPADPSLAPAEINPQVNPQLTNVEGRYGWDVAIGCWFVVVEAPGYATRVSPAVGVPPEVTDLHLALTPAAPTGGGGGDVALATSGSFVPDPAGNAGVSLTTSAGTVLIGFRGLTAGGSSSASVMAAPPDANRTLLPTAFDLIVTLGQTFRAAEVCVPYRESEAAALGLPERELRLFHIDGGVTVDITTSIDVDRNVICGETDGFSPFAVGVADVAQVQGVDRIGTSVAVSRSAFADGDATSAVLARADDFADALVGGVAAAEVGGPLLLTTSDGLSAATSAELLRVLPLGSTVRVLGGTAAVGVVVVDQLVSLGYRVERVAGADRYETSVAVARMVAEPTQVLIAAGEAGRFADALTAGSAAAATGGVVVLTDGERVPPAVRSYLDEHDDVPQHGVGGPAARAVPGANPIAGADRYETAALVAARFFPGAEVASIATGVGFADALSAATLSAVYGYPVLLVAGTVPAPTAAIVEGLSRVVVVGGSTAVPPSVSEQLLALLN